MFSRFNLYRVKATVGITIEEEKKGITLWQGAWNHADLGKIILFVYTYSLHVLTVSILLPEST